MPSLTDSSDEYFLYVCVCKSLSALSVVVIGVRPRHCLNVCKAVRDFEQASVCVHVCACLLAEEVATVGGRTKCIRITIIIL